jgi:hypothetical protein
MKKIAGVVGLLTLLVSSVAMAAAGWGGYATVSSIEVDAVTTGNSLTYVYFSTVPAGKPSCTSTGQAVMTGSTDSVKAMTSVVTAAFLAGRSVRVYYDGTCDSTYGRIAAVQMQ